MGRGGQDRLKQFAKKFQLTNEEQEDQIFWTQLEHALAAMDLDLAEVFVRRRCADGVPESHEGMKERFQWISTYQKVSEANRDPDTLEDVMKEFEIYADSLVKLGDESDDAKSMATNLKAAYRVQLCIGCLLGPVLENGENDDSFDMDVVEFRKSAEKHLSKYKQMDETKLSRPGGLGLAYAGLCYDELMKLAEQLEGPSAKSKAKGKSKKACGPASASKGALASLSSFTEKHSWEGFLDDVKTVGLILQRSKGFTLLEQCILGKGGRKQSDTVINNEFIKTADRSPKKKKKKTADHDMGPNELLDGTPPPKKKRKRENVKPWTETETDALIEGVRLCGVGKWSDILKEFAEVFAANQRTNVNLKDKWRNIQLKK
eukprot:CAMPEP_0203750754 /NCGR_PEP_ID=MMETSP0098-20131031/4938_1 /ASSEMBLY_ACC=CAM_ASM_000208 /TAXON_ID=96639 /ORGANISM=" , Strain NY0313808BC1" /LENGTH=374 /DNA_ID=CAMNT_0050640185 /DNA_START=185 /DNA_END=1306 /DNA_ORIENTATION=+